MQGYGLTETTACATVMSPQDRTTGRTSDEFLKKNIKFFGIKIVSVTPKF